jgi:hypothetical protein
VTGRTSLEGPGLGGVAAPGQPAVAGQPALASHRPDFATRAAAFVIDLLLAATVVFLLSALIGTFVYAPRATPGELQPTIALEMLLASLLATLPTAWAVLAWRGAGRATPGQRLYHLQVVSRHSGERLSLVAAGARWLLLYAPVALMVGYPTIIEAAVPSQLALLDLYGLPWLAVTLTALPLLWYAALAGVDLHDRLCGSMVIGAERAQAPGSQRWSPLRQPLLWLSVLGALIVAIEGMATMSGQLWDGWDILAPATFTIADTLLILLPAALLWRAPDAGRRHPLLLAGLAIGAALFVAPVIATWVSRGGPDLAAIVQIAPLTWLRVLAPAVVGLGLLAMRRSGPTRPILLVAIVATVMVGAAVPALINGGQELLLLDLGLVAIYAGVTGFALWVPATAWLDGERPRWFWALLALGLPLQLTSILGSGLLIVLMPAERLPDIQPWLFLVGALTALLAATLALVAYGGFTPRAAATTPSSGERSV